MRIGSAKTDICPKCKIHLTGFAAPNRQHLGTHDPIYLTSTVIEQDGVKVAFVSGDVLGFDRDKLIAVRKEIADKTGIEPINIMFNASHTHSAPETLGWINQTAGAYVAEYADFFYEAVVDTVVSANADLEEGELYWGTIDCYGIGVNRRNLVDGKYVFAPIEKGLRNDEVTVVKAVCGGKIKSVMFNYSCHPSTICFDYVSADWPGVACRIVGEKYNCVAEFLQGCCGDIRVRTVDDSGHDWRAGTYDDIEKFGSLLASRVDALLSRPMKKVEGKISTKFTSFDIPLLDKLPREVYAERAKDESRSLSNRWASNFYAENYDTLPDARPYSAQRIDLGDSLTFWGLEGEVCTPYCFNVKAMMPDRHVVVCGYSNGDPGYIFAEYMVPQGGYEPVDSRDPYLLGEGFRYDIERIILKKCEEIAK